MPESNCAIYGCGACRTKKYKEISIFKLPKAVDDETKRWRNEILNVITRDRVIDVGLREQIREDRVYICEQHFRQWRLVLLGIEGNAPPKVFRRKLFSNCRFSVNLMFLCCKL